MSFAKCLPFCSHRNAKYIQITWTQIYIFAYPNSPIRVINIMKRSGIIRRWGGIFREKYSLNGYQKLNIYHYAITSCKISATEISTEMATKWYVTLAKPVTEIKRQSCRWLYISKCCYWQTKYELYACQPFIHILVELGLWPTSIKHMFKCI